MRIGLRILAAGIAVSIFSAASMAGELGVGMKAPKLEVAKWFKGTPAELGDGKMVHVIEMWATW